MSHFSRNGQSCICSTISTCYSIQEELLAKGLEQYKQPNLRGFRKALAGCLELHQRTMFQHNMEWKNVWLVDCHILYDTVKGRKTRIDCRIYKEKMDNTFALYTCVVEIVKIECIRNSIQAKKKRKYVYHS